ncbi:hypothetical protein [Microbacterium gorillae]|uniref:hypothetical protein n=1 Tax=Microbacterium gorillae TaxID=1231063 RepID=UPI00058D9DEB|nr:hypothetical protein [Microbacterium gorillae]
MNTTTLLTRPVDSGVARPPILDTERDDRLGALDRLSLQLGLWLISRARRPHPQRRLDENALRRAQLDTIRAEGFGRQIL